MLCNFQSLGYPWPFQVQMCHPQIRKNIRWGLPWVLQGFLCHCQRLNVTFRIENTLTHVGTCWNLNPPQEKSCRSTKGEDIIHHGQVHRLAGHDAATQAGPGKGSCAVRLMLESEVCWWHHDDTPQLDPQSVPIPNPSIPRSISPRFLGKTPIWFLESRFRPWITRQVVPEFDLPGTISQVWKLWFLLLRVTWETPWMARSWGPKEMINSVAIELWQIGRQRKGDHTDVVTSIAVLFGSYNSVGFYNLGSTILQFSRC